MGRRRQALLLMDANVLIDYLDSDRRVFRLATEHVGQIHVPAPLLTEEIVADDVDWAALGVVAVEPSVPMYAEAGARGGSLKEGTGRGRRFSCLPLLFFRNRWAHDDERHVAMGSRGYELLSTRRG